MGSCHSQCDGEAGARGRGRGRGRGKGPGQGQGQGQGQRTLCGSKSRIQVHFDPKPKPNRKAAQKLGKHEHCRVQSFAIKGKQAAIVHTRASFCQPEGIQQDNQKVLTRYQQGISKVFARAFSRVLSSVLIRNLSRVLTGGFGRLLTWYLAGY